MVAAAVLTMGLAEPRPVMAVEAAPPHAVPATGPIRILSYNVEGLP